MFILILVLLPPNKLIQVFPNTSKINLISLSLLRNQNQFKNNRRISHIYKKSHQLNYGNKSSPPLSMPINVSSNEEYLRKIILFFLSISLSLTNFLFLFLYFNFTFLHSNKSNTFVAFIFEIHGKKTRVLKFLINIGFYSIQFIELICTFIFYFFIKYILFFIF